MHFADRLPLFPCCCVFVFTGCNKAPSPAATTPKPPRVMVKRVPCRIKYPMNLLAATLEVDLSELKNLVLDAKQLYAEIVSGEPSSTAPEKGSPVILVVNKKDNKFTYFQLTPNVKQIRLKNKDSKEVSLIVKNQEPLQIELWLDSVNDVEVDIEFKDDVSSASKEK
jgi:hypothetical protein